jgi:transcriptional regulator GlxA family with amidase domain
MNNMPTVGILLYPDVEVLDFAGPYEVLACSRDIHSGHRFNVKTIAPEPEITCFGGLRVSADLTFEAQPELDIFLVPGGPGAREPYNPQILNDFIREQAQRSKLVASVCTGTFLLARAGLLDGKVVTTHPRRMEAFRHEFPEVRVIEKKIVEQGDIVTAGGVSSGIDLALLLLERYCGDKARNREAIRLDGPWR